MYRWAEKKPPCPFTNYLRRCKHLSFCYGQESMFADRETPFFSKRFVLRCTACHKNLNYGKSGKKCEIGWSKWQQWDFCQLAVYYKGFITDNTLDLRLIYDYTESSNILWEKNYVSFFLQSYCASWYYQSFFYQLMHKKIALKRISKLTLKQLLHVSV
jgi:hypothetical protein